MEFGHHKGGFLPFASDLTALARPGARHRLTVSADNSLDWSCLPGGEVTTRPFGAEPGATCRMQLTDFDFFNYSGVSRPVRLLGLPATHLTAIDARPSPHMKLGVSRQDVVLQIEPGDGWFAL